MHTEYVSVKNNSAQGNPGKVICKKIGKQCYFSFYIHLLWTIHELSRRSLSHLVLSLVPWYIVLAGIELIFLLETCMCYVLDSQPKLLLAQQCSAYCWIRFPLFLVLPYQQGASCAPSHQYSVKLCCCVIQASRRAVWQNDVWHGCVYEAKIWNWIPPRESLCTH